MLKKNILLYILLINVPLHGVDSLELIPNNVQPPVQMSAAMYLALQGNDEQSFAAILQQAPEQINAVDGISNKTPLMRAALRNKAAFMRELILHGACLNTQDSWGQTALIHAARQPAIAAVKLLVEEGADIDCVSHEGYTALSVACYHYRNPPRKKEAHLYRNIADYLHEQLSMQIGGVRSILMTNCLFPPEVALLVIQYRFADNDRESIQEQTQTALAVSSQLAGHRTKRKKPNRIPVPRTAPLKKHKASKD